MAHDWSGNSVSDGYYVDLYTGDVLPLQSSYGFVKSTFDAAVPAVVYNASALTTTAINAAITAANSAGGGIVRLPSGSGSLSSAIVAKSNVLVEGAGIGSTTLVYNGATNGRVLSVEDVQNFVIRDVTLDANGLARNCIVSQNSTNVMVERCSIEGPSSRENGFTGRYTNNITIRYCTITGFNRHGIAVKDCYEDEGVTAGTTAYCAAQYSGASGAYGTAWTTSFAVYSNTITSCGVHGLNYHGLNAEICGNLITNNTHGGKFFDGRGVLFHDNRIDGNGHGFMFNFTLDIADHVTGNIYIRCNSFGENGDWDLYFGDQYGIGYDPITLDSNTYTNGDILGLGNIAQADLLVCSGSAEEGLISAGERTTAAAGDCLGCDSAVSQATIVEHVVNGDFADDGDWVLDTDGTITVTFGEDTNDVVLDITSGGTDSTFYQPNISITNTTQYRLTFSAVASVACSLPVTLTDSTGVTNRGLSETFSVGTTVGIFAARFAATATDTTAMLNFVLTSLSSVDLTIDNVSLVSVSSGISVDFKVDETSGTYPLDAQFTDLTISSESLATWTWKDNGTTFSSSQNPARTLATGSHSIALTVTTSSYSGTETKLGYIEVEPSGVVSGSGSDDISIAAGLDDVEYRSTPAIDTTIDPRTSFKTGLRFVMASDIPAGATITSAYITLYARGSGTLPNLTIAVEDTGNAAQYAGTTGDFSSRSEHATTVSWNPSVWTLNNSYQTPDISSLVQAIVDDYSGISTSEAIAIRINNPADDGTYIKFAGYDGAYSANRPVLHLEWTYTTTPTVPDATVTQDLEVTASTDDVERRSGGYDAALTGIRTYYRVGLRFELNTAIPDGATVSAAILSVYSDGSSGLPIEHTIYLEDTDDAATFAGSSDFDTRYASKTTANTGWDVSSWMSGQWYEIADLMDEVQELVDANAGLAAGAGIVVFINNDTGSGFVKFDSYDNVSGNAPRLSITADEPRVSAAATIAAATTVSATAILRATAVATIASNATITAATATVTHNASATIASALSISNADLRGPTPLSATISGQTAISAAPTMTYAASATIAGQLTISRATIPTHRISATIALASGITASLYTRPSMGGEGAIAHFRTASSTSTRSTDREKRSGVARKGYKP